MENKILIDSVNNLKVALNEISVYDFDVYTSMELYYKIAENFNKVIRELSRFEGVISEEIVKQNEKLIYLLGEGLNQEVVKKIDNMVETGVFDTIINLNIFNNLKEDIKNVSSQLEQNMIKLNELWADVKNFGAMCDRVTDDTEIIKSVIEKGYKNIKINNCLISDNIEIPKGVNLLISNLLYKGTTQSNKTGFIFLKGDNIVNGLNEVNEGISLIADGSNILFENIEICNSVSGSFIIAIRSDTTYSNINYKNCISRESSTHGFKIDKYTTNSFTNSTVANITYDNCKAFKSGVDITAWSVGFLIADVTNANNIIYKNCVATDSVESGFHIENHVNITNIIYDNCISRGNGQRKENPTYGTGFFVYENTYFNNCHTYNNANSPCYYSYTNKENVDDINEYHFLSKDIDIYEKGVKYEYNIINGENGFELNNIFNKSNCFFPLLSYNLHSQIVGDKLVLTNKLKTDNGCIKISQKNSCIRIESPDNFIESSDNNYSVSLPPIKIDSAKKYKIRFKALVWELLKNNKIRVGTSIYDKDFKCIQRLHFNRIITLDEKEKYYEYDIVTGSNLIDANGVYMGLTFVLSYDDSIDNYSKRLITDISIIPIEYETRLGLPSNGTYSVGDIVKNSNPEEIGDEGNKYIIEKWICIASGTPGTWRPCRMLTGN